MSERRLGGCITRALLELLESLGLKQCSGAVLSASRRIKPLELPYTSRSEKLASTIRRHIALLKECGLEAIVFLQRGLRDYIIACVADRIDVVFEGERRVRDDLSGLSIRARRAYLLIGDCRVNMVWRRTKLVLEGEELEKCRFCQKRLC